MKKNQTTFASLNTAIEKFLSENWHPIEVSDYLNTRIECIDDRSDAMRGDNVIRIPGGRLGVLMDSLGALKIIDEKGIEVHLSSDDLIDATKQVVGSFDFHTAETHLNHSLPFAGCGHCAGAFEHPHDYLLSADALDVIREAVENSNARATSVYSGNHNAHGVLIITEEHIGIPSKGEDGQFYVYHQQHHRNILSRIAEKVFEKISRSQSGVSLQYLTNVFQESGERRLAPTVEHLAGDLPKFVVIFDELEQKVLFNQIGEQVSQN